MRVSKTKFIRVLKRHFPELADIRRRLQKGEISLEEAVKLFLQRKTVMPVEKQNEPVDFVIKAGSWRIGVEVEDNVNVHPTPERFRPQVLGVNPKTKTALIRVYEGRYHSNRHDNRLTFSYDAKETPDGFAVLVKYSLYRSGLEYGRYREFSYVVGFGDGSSFVDRVSPEVDSVEEALEWMKPAEVRKAEAEGRKVLRQGDVFFVELRSRRRSLKDYNLPSNHRVVVEGNTVKVVHHEHSVLILPHAYFKPVVRKTIVGTVRRTVD